MLLRSLVAPFIPISQRLLGDRAKSPEVWIAELYNWFVQWRCVWIAIAVPILIFIVCSSCSAVSQYVGMTVMQLAGLACALVGVLQTRRKVSLPGLRAMIRSMFEQFPIPVRKRTIHILQPDCATMSLHASDVNLRVTKKFPVTSLADLAEAIEKRFAQTDDELERVRDDVRKKEETLRQALENEHQERMRGEQRLGYEMRQIVIGGLNLEMLGLFWVLVGTVGAVFVAM